MRAEAIAKGVADVPARTKWGVAQDWQPMQIWSTVRAWLGVICARLAAVRPAKRLRVCETVPLGDKRFVAVVQFERSRFLIGGAPNSVVLLTKLEEDGTASFTEALAVAERGHA